MKDISKIMFFLGVAVYMSFFSCTRGSVVTFENEKHEKFLKGKLNFELLPENFFLF